MAKFDMNKKGYDPEQVDNFINKLSLKYEEKLSEQKDRVFSLKNELSMMEERLESYKDKDKKVSQALILAVEKAEQIEGNASKLYDLEIKRLRLLYKEWEEMLILLKTIQMPQDVAKKVLQFEKTIQEVIEQNKRIGGGVVRKDLHKNSDNYIRNLLNKMDYAINERPQVVNDKVVSNLATENEKENNRIINLKGKLSSISAKGTKSMAENYLNSDEEFSSVFANSITRKGKKKQEESGFDMDDILMPKEDLDEIMKSFDFFLQENKDN